MQNRINRIKSTYIVKLDRAAWAVSCGADPCRKVVKYLVEEAGLNGARQGGEQGVEEQNPQELRPGAGAGANHRPVEDNCKLE